MTFMRENKMTTFAVIGLGRMGRVHIQAGLNSGFTLCGIWDQSVEVMTEVASQNQLGLDATTFASLESMLLTTKPDLVVVATTATSHCEIVVQIAKLGPKHILCEKPISTSISEAKLMIEACKLNDVKLAINHQMRFMDQYQVVRDEVETGRLGELRSMMVSASNFGLTMNSTHYFEAFNWLSCSSTEFVTGWIDEEKIINPRGPQFVDFSGQILVQNNDGKRLYIDFSADLGNGVLSVYNFTYGKIVINELQGKMEVFGREAEHLALGTQRYGMPSWSETKKIKSAELVDSTAEVMNHLLNNDSFPDGAVGLNALTVALSGLLSSMNASTKIQVNDPRLQDLQYSFA